MDLEKQAFRGLIEYYKLLPNDIKRSEIISEFEDLISDYSKLCTKFNLIPNMTLNREILNINRSDLKEEEFLQAVYAYLNTLEDISGQFINKISDLIENK